MTERGCRGWGGRGEEGKEGEEEEKEGKETERERLRKRESCLLSGCGPILRERITFHNWLKKGDSPYTIFPLK